jgi:hypothetical protein
MPTSRSVSQIKSALLHPATTSHFEVKIPLPQNLPANASYWRDNGVKLDQDKLQLMCSEATLPGSNLATLELTNDHTGVTERHAYRRVYDDRIDLTFYVDAENYLPIRFFETWMKYISNESKSPDRSIGVSLNNDNYFYRFRYRDDYIAKQGLEVIKFERSTYASGGNYNYKNKGTSITYKFVNAFPISLSSIPVSYDSSSLLKCIVSMSYLRYYIDRTVDESQSDTTTPTQQAQFNSSNLTLPGLEGSGSLSTGGVSQSVANASGNTIDRRIEAGLPGVGRNNFVERSIFGP